MLMPDVNVLVYAHRADERFHPHYKRWLEDQLNASAPLALSVLVAVAFVRIVTNPRVFSIPTPIAEALSAIDRIATHPACRVVAPTADHWNRVAELCRATGATAKLVADAQHAALAIAEGCTWMTRDADFGRFAPHGLSWTHLVLETG